MTRLSGAGDRVAANSSLVHFNSIGAVRLLATHGAVSRLNRQAALPSDFRRIKVWQ
jgi:hypothetical protein